MRNQLGGFASVCLMALAGLVLWAPSKSLAQVPGSPVVTVTRVQISPPGPPVGTYYTVTMTVHSRAAGVVWGQIQVPGLDRVDTNHTPNPQFYTFAAGQTGVFSFRVYCGENGGLVQGRADLRR